MVTKPINTHKCIKKYLTDRKNVPSTCFGHLMAILREVNYKEFIKKFYEPMKRFKAPVICAMTRKVL